MADSLLTFPYWRKFRLVFKTASSIILVLLMKIILFRQKQTCASDPWMFISSSELSWCSTAEAKCLEGLPLWRNNSTEINQELYKGYNKGNQARTINEIVAGSLHACPYAFLISCKLSINNLYDLLPFAAYDFLNTDRSRLNVSIWYNATYKEEGSGKGTKMTRVPASVNLVNLLLFTMSSYM